MRTLLTGALAALLGRSLLIRLILLKLRADVRRLSDGDYAPLLSSYAQDAVLHFNEGPHRWSGEHRGKPAIERFLREFTAAKIRGEIRALWIGGPPWAMTLVVRFDDRAEAPDGERIYENRTALVARSRWGRIVEQWDYYEDTGRIVAFDERLRELQTAPADGTRTR